MLLGNGLRPHCKVLLMLPEAKVFALMTEPIRGFTPYCSYP